MLGIIPPMPIRSEELKGHLDGLILAVLAGEPLHGYAIIEELKRRSGGALAVPEGTVYPALHRLERSGLLQSSWSDGTRRRRVYQLTARGRRELGARRESWRQFAATIEAVLA
jgi:transcriptional regulator